MQAECSHYRNILRGVSIHSLLKKVWVRQYRRARPILCIGFKNRNTNDGNKKADLEKYKRWSRCCEIVFFLNRLQGYGIARGCSPLRDWEAVWLGKAHWRLGKPFRQGQSPIDEADKTGKFWDPVHLMLCVKWYWVLNGAPYSALGATFSAFVV